MTEAPMRVAGFRRTRKWIDRLAAFFEARGSALGHVLEAAGCREGWLHGELHREFRTVNGFLLNRQRLGEREKADISIEGKMVGEIKILGSGYQRKVITGGSLKPLLERRGRLVTAADESLVRGPWALIPDYFRLLRAPLPVRIERLLILVADVATDDRDPVAEALRTIEFEGDERRIPLSRGLVRIWKLAAG